MTNPDLEDPPDFDDPADAQPTPGIPEVKAEPVPQDEILMAMDSSGYRPDERDIQLLRSHMRLIRENPGKIPTPTKLARCVGVSRDWVVARQSNAAFSKWFKSGVEYIRATQVASVHESLLVMATKGKNVNAAKLFMQRFDNGFSGPTSSRALAETQAAAVDMESVIGLIVEKSGCSRSDAQLLLSGRAKVVPI